MSRLHFLERLRVDALNVMISGRGHQDGFIRVDLFLLRRCLYSVPGTHSCCWLVSENWLFPCCFVSVEISILGSFPFRSCFHLFCSDIQFASCVVRGAFVKYFFAGSRISKGILEGAVEFVCNFT